MKEVRSFEGDAAPRIEGRKVSGYAIVFNQRSEVLLDGGKSFRELILPTAVTMEFLNTQDIFMVLEHERTRLLARSTNGQGSLSYKVTPTGVMYEFEAPNTSEGDYAVEMLRRGDLRASSFAFAAGGERWEDGGRLRVITSFKRISDFSIVSRPAYPQTTSQVRARLEGQKNVPESVKRMQKQLAKERIDSLRKELDELEHRQRLIDARNGVYKR
ncbi:MAG: HK97 family phage prohead protease [Bacteroidota bacterium]|nr:HK97 family phage prohead protease [Bacteroidota bacterium]